jgi:hypothetical protein
VRRNNASKNGLQLVIIIGHSLIHYLISKLHWRRWAKDAVPVEFCRSVIGLMACAVKAEMR